MTELTFPYETTTRDGSKVTLLARHPSPDAPYPLVGFLENSEVLQTWTGQGGYYITSTDHPLDLPHLPSPVQPEVGKTYKTRAGYLAHIHARSDSPYQQEAPLFGIIEHHGGYLISSAWTDTGGHSLLSELGSQYDIVEEVQ